VKFARHHVQAESLVAIIHPDNRASERVAEKLGMARVADDLGGSFPRRVLRMPLRRSPADPS
jgi:RimJ/RimL family protein N-acetyltransferase